MFELIPGFASFLIWEQQSKDTIDFKKVYVDMAGDLLSGLLLSQLVFWYLPGKDGTNKLRVQREDEFWVVKSRDQWWEEIRMAPREVDKCLEQLRAAGIIETRVWKFAGNPTTHIRILPEGFMDCLNAVIKEGRERPKGKFQRDGRRGKKALEKALEEEEGLLQKCDNPGYLKSVITKSQKCDNLELINVRIPSLTFMSSSTETLSENTKENSQTPDSLPSAVGGQDKTAETQTDEYRAFYQQSRKAMSHPDFKAKHGRTSEEADWDAGAREKMQELKRQDVTRAREAEAGDLR